MTRSFLNAVTRDVLDNHEMAHVEAATVINSLSPASAREVRIERIISSQANLVEEA